jgi:hypothetical protein
MKLSTPQMAASQKSTSNVLTFVVPTASTYLHWPRVLLIVPACASCVQARTASSARTAIPIHDRLPSVRVVVGIPCSS